MKNETICIHCKHGVNRTGYIICSYLILVKGIDNLTAIQQFEQARGVQIENKGYVTSLMKLKQTD